MSQLDERSVRATGTLRNNRTADAAKKLISKNLQKMKTILIITAVIYVP